jgi:DNA-binding CsgD family transcriptional regulator
MHGVPKESLEPWTLRRRDVPIGRQFECELLDRLLDAVRAGESRALVLRGEPGIGKTVLLEHLCHRATGFRVARAIGIQSEMELPFAALHQLCAPLLDRLERLPSPQRDALATAFGLSQGVAPDRFFLGLAVLRLLSEAADERPLLCLVDDAQWLDRESAQALSIAARRLLAEPVGLVFATRIAGDELTGLREHELRGLDEADARVLLAEAVSAPIDEQVRDRIVKETGGNPLALTELPRELTPSQLAGGFGLPHLTGLSGRIEESFQRRLESLPAETRLLLLAAAAEPLGSLALLWRAARILGIERVAAAPATAAGLAEFAATVRFRHPLVRSGIYRAAKPEDRRRVHSALAEATDPEVDPDRRAWHRARATRAPDEDVADELERSAGRALQRGGLAAAAAFLEQAATLTPDPVVRARRELDAGEAMLQAGAFDDSLALLASADSRPLDDVGRARVELLRGRVAFAMDRVNEAPPLLLAAAKRLEPLDLGLARETYLDAFLAAAAADHLAEGGDALEVARAARAAPVPPEPHRPLDQLLESVALLVTDGPAAAEAPLKRALDAFLGGTPDRDGALRWSLLMSHIAAVTWDYERWQALCARHVRLFREAGDLSMLPFALNSRICAHVFAGEVTQALSLLEEITTVTETTRGPPRPYGMIALAALQGREGEALRLVDAHMAELVNRGEGIGVTLVEWALGMLYNGLGRYEDTVAACEQALGQKGPLGVSSWTRMELVEAAVHCGQRELAAEALKMLPAPGSGSDWAGGAVARSRALLSNGEAAEAFYREAIERLDRGGVGGLLARTRLVYGEWLRREGRRRDAREQLRIATDQLSAMGFEAFADRAARELRATGETARRRNVATRGDLTARESEIARLARDGLTNSEIGTRLFISPRTVEYHLHNIFGKLAIGSRGELASVLRG